MSSVYVKHSFSTHVQHRKNSLIGLKPTVVDKNAFDITKIFLFEITDTRDWKFPIKPTVPFVLIQMHIIV